MIAARDRDFDGVRAGSLTRVACSPRVEDDPSFRGLRLAAPARVALGAALDPFSSTSSRVIVCGALHLELDYLGLRGRLLTQIVLVAVSATTHRAFSARFEPAPNPVTSPARAGREPGAWPEGSIIQYFNPNLAEVLPLPEEEATYFVYATLGAHVSNVVRIELRRLA